MKHTRAEVPGKIDRETHFSANLDNYGKPGVEVIEDRIADLDTANLLTSLPADRYVKEARLHAPVIDPDGKILLIRRSRMHTTPLPPIQEGGHATYQGVVHKVSSPPAPATPQSAMIPWEGRAVCGRWLTCHTATTVMVTCPACLAQPAIRRQALAEMVDCALEACLYEATSGSARGIR